MDEWANKYFGRASFICVGCDGPALAEAFASRLQLKKCTLTYAPRGPSWGQLGCSGFIVLDGAGRVVCRKTSSFLDLNDLAFGHVEALVDAMLDGSPLPKVCPGQMVQLVGLSKAELNGQKGVCFKRVDPESGRCAVHIFSDRRQLSVKPENLLALDGEAEQLDDDETACDAGEMDYKTGGCCDQKEEEGKDEAPPTADACSSGDGSVAANRAGPASDSHTETSTAAADGPTIKLVRGLKSGQLKAVLRSLELDAKGSTADLRARLLNAAASSDAVAEAIARHPEVASGAVPSPSEEACGCGGEGREPCGQDAKRPCTTDAPEVPPDAVSSRVTKALEAQVAPTTAPAAAVTVTKKEAFKGGVSLGVCANALCLCAECECGKGCTCNVGDKSGVVQEDTCEQCTDFRAAKAAKKEGEAALPDAAGSSARSAT